MRTRFSALARTMAMGLLLLPGLVFAQVFRFTTIDIGQGDAAVVIAPGGCAALFDGGPTGSGATIKEYLRSLGVTRVDMAFNSHFHADHLGGLDEVEQGTDAIPIAAVYDRGGSYSSTAFDQYAAQFSGKRNAVTLGQTFSLCNQVTLKVVAVNGNGVNSSNENAYSVTVKVSYGDFDALVGGDLTGVNPDDVESVLASTVGEVELYKVHHHGSRYSSNDTFLAALKPTVSFISVGMSNTYGHPTPECLGRLSAHGSDIWQTEDPSTSTKRGHIALSSSTGSSFTVAQGSNSVTYPSKGGADTQAPSAPGSLVASAVSSSGIDLSWTASTDNVGVTGYRVYRSGDGVSFALAGTSTGTGFADTGLIASTSYSYRVTAVDAAGNESSASNTATAITLAPDLIAPSAPANATATSSSAGAIAVTWSASTDNVGVTGYKVYRSSDGATFAFLASTSSTGYTDSGLPSATTRWYRVTATDAAGNESAASNVASATTVTSSVTVTAPNGGESWAGNSTQNLTWTSAYVSNVKLEYSLDNGGTWTVIASSVSASTGSYAWTVPNSASTSARVRVSDAQNGTPVDTSNAVFTITAATPAKVILNELLVNEPGSTTSAEFVEIVNVGGTSISIAGWKVTDSTVRHTFAAGTTLAPGKAITVFGGASAIPPGINAVAASSGSLSLNNTGGTIYLKNGKTTVDSVAYTSSQVSVDGVSLNRSPDANASGSWVLHTSVSSAGSSPGTRANGSAY